MCGGDGGEHCTEAPHKLSGVCSVAHERWSEGYKNVPAVNLPCTALGAYSAIQSETICTGFRFRPGVAMGGRHAKIDEEL